VTIGQLQMSFYGPFVCLLDQDLTQIYAPRCIGHYASISDSEDEAPLTADRYCGMHKTFMVSKSGIQSNLSSVTPVHPDTHLRPPKNFALSKDPRSAWFSFQLPKPTHAIGMMTDQVAISGTNAPTGTTWATAFRLLFNYDMGHPEFEVTDGRDTVFATKLIDYGSGNPLRFDISVRNLGPFLFDPDHDDAFTCFEASRRLFLCEGSELDWELDYDSVSIPNTGNGKYHLVGKVGGDCGAPAFIVT
jgi:hypothetical protein